MKHLYAYLVFILIAAAAASPAQAARGYVSTNVYLRAGPGVEYPVVSRVYRGARLEIYNCIEGWGWCEIESGPYRGWVSGRYLQAPYDNRPTYIVESGPYVNVPLVNFNVVTYWDRYYRDKPFYRDRGRWEHRDRHDHDDRRRDHDRGRGHGRGHDRH